MEKIILRIFAAYFADSLKNLDAGDEGKIDPTKQTEILENEEKPKELMQKYPEENILEPQSSWTKKDEWILPSSNDENSSKHTLNILIAQKDQLNPPLSTPKLDANTGVSQPPSPGFSQPWSPGQAGPSGLQNEV